MPELLPLFLNVTGRQVVLVGGGRVAAAKLRQLLAVGARVRDDADAGTDGEQLAQLRRRNAAAADEDDLPSGHVQEEWQQFRHKPRSAKASRSSLAESLAFQRVQGLARRKKSPGSCEPPGPSGLVGV